ncbi:MAG: hypothetical protein ACFFBI_11780 [Promethearchaeota archaeon]
MNEKIELKMDYYDFLFNVQKISQNLHSIQKNVINHVFENYDICHFINKLDRQIEHLDRLLTSI